MRNSGIARLPTKGHPRILIDRTIGRIGMGGGIRYHRQLRNTQGIVSRCRDAYTLHRHVRCEHYAEGVLIADGNSSVGIVSRPARSERTSLSGMEKWSAESQSCLSMRCRRHYPRCRRSSRRRLRLCRQLWDLTSRSPSRRRSNGIAIRP